MPTKPSEQRFEEHIEQSLIKQGYTKLLYTEYNKELCLITNEVLTFIKETQKDEYEKLVLQFEDSTDSQLLKTLNNAIASRGIVDTLRKGISTRGCSFDLVYFEPSSGLNEEHGELFKKNRFVVVRQLKYSQKNENSIDMVLFLNGIPILTMELKNQLTGQNILDSQKQYQYDRDPKEPLLNFKRCLAHFCVDNDKVSMTSQLRGNGTRFLPYNRGIENPKVENDYKTAYLWNDILTPSSLLNIIENFVVITEESDKEWNDKTKKVEETKFDVQVFPRYHQLEVIRNLKKQVKLDGVGHNYLVMHSAGSGKSLSIGWLSHTLASLYRTSKDTKRMFDSIIVVTDRIVLDKQLRKTIKSLQQVEGVVNAVENTSSELKTYLQKGKDIIIVTIQKFGVIADTMSELKGQTFAVIIDEAHSSQSGESAKQLKKTLSVNDNGEEEEEDYQDIIRKEIESRGRQNHISYFAFTATPKDKTLELFGTKNAEGKYAPFHTYSMQQSIAEGFTLDVLKSYTTYKRYFKVIQKSGEDIEVPEGKVKRELVNFVDSHPEVIRQKVAIILDHFIRVTSKKINGRGRAMVVVRSRKHCVLFQEEMVKQMKFRNLPYSCLVAFSGTIQYHGRENTEATLNKENGMKGNDIPTEFKDPRYRILIVSNKFQTGFDEPLLHSMYVDKKLGGIQAVQTLSRLNRTKTGKTDTFVLDFTNDTEDIVKSFQPYYTTTELSSETDPDKLYDIEYKIEEYHVFTTDMIEGFCKEFYTNSKTDEKLQPFLNEAVENWKKLDSDEKRENFKSECQSFCRLYSFVSQVSTFAEIRWEKLFIFLRYLLKKLPRREGERVFVSSYVDLDSLRIQMIGESNLSLESKTGVLDPMSATSGKPKDEEKELLSEIIKQVNSVFGVQLNEEDKVDLKHIGERLQQNSELEAVMKGNNSEDNKKDFFTSLFKDEVGDYYTDRMDFYKKVVDNRIFPMLLDVMYQEYRRGKNL